ncbi:MAG: DUF3575 domain-containing protein, partial [Muribaculum sp.]|nr:DUF3575 domain-containing protein [Muribaculaceae bacterium]MCM1081205.1 DUF3575 domain-containing protein [Muribaculum sp.]
MKHTTEHICSTLTSIRALAVSLLITVGFAYGHAQDAAVKTNLLYDAALMTANAGVEVRLAPKWTLDVSGNINAWEFS